MKNDTKNIHLCFENLFINISEDKQEENTNNYGRIWETRYNLKSPKHKIERGLVLDIEPTNTYRRKILRMLDTFVSLMYCSHLSIKPTQFMLGEKHESEETRYNQSETAHKTIFRCWDSNHIWVKNSENARNFCNYYELSSSRLTLWQIHNSQTSCSIYYLLNLLKAFDSSDIHYIRKLSTPPLFIIQNQAK